MSETGCCPYCGSARTAADGLAPVYREMRRIREIAEARTPDDAERRIADDAERRIAELTREVAELRATVARLRGPRSVSLAATPAHEPGRVP